ncbi:hypothetical protein KUTeg_007796 [Tegillarca granosa]|uniref:Uncharacterized protein n=1 Tax=Tegillarca granosa TaxID=220873 RepID=A0ABQ9FG77_TEGGR|nr:hypothetical protein KUTeg_007796 [Tegillarca granosa]
MEKRERTKMYRNGFFQNDQSSSQEEPAKSDSMKYMDWRNMTHDISQNQGPRTQNHYENPSFMPDVQTGKPPSYYYGYKIETYLYEVKFYVDYCNHGNKL